MSRPYTYVSSDLTRKEVKKLTAECSDPFWAKVYELFEPAGPGAQIALAMRIGRFRQAQSDLREALKWRSVSDAD